MYPLIFYSLFFFLFIPQITANPKQQTEEELFKQADQFNQTGFGVLKTECQQCWTFSESEDNPQQEKDSDPLLYQCAVDLCGPSKKSPRYTFLNNTTFDINDIDPKITKTFNEKIHPLIEEAVNNKINYRRQALVNWEKGMQNPDAKFKQWEWDKFAETLTQYRINTEITLDENKKPTTQYTIDEHLVQDMSPAETKGMMSYMKNKNKTPPTKDRLYAIRSTNSNTTNTSNEVIKFLRERYQKILTEYDNNNKLFTAKDNGYVQWLEEAMTNDDTIESNQDNIARNLDLLTKKSTNHAFCFEKDCKNWVRDEITSLYQGLKQGVQNQADNIAKYMQYCRSIYTANIINTRNTQTYRENLPKYRDQFFNSAVFTNYSKETRQAIEVDLKGKKFTLPPTEDDMQSYFIAHINNENEYQSRLNTRPIHFTDLLEDKTTLKNNDDFGVCPSIREQFSKDRASGRVSLFSCTFHEHGKQILAHEFGHALSYWFKGNNPESNEKTKASEKSYTQYTTLRKCAAKRYEKEKRAGYWQNDKFRTEEDTADLIAHLTFSDESTLAMCYALKTSKDGSKYQTNSIAIINPESGDTHSARLLRVIMEAIHKRKKLSSSCRKVINKYKDEVNFDPCFNTNRPHKTRAQDGDR